MLHSADLAHPGLASEGFFQNPRLHSWEWAKDNVDAELPLGKPCSGWAEATRSRDDQSSLALYWDILGMLIPSPKLGVQEAFSTSLPTGNPG